MNYLKCGNQMCYSRLKLNNELSLSIKFDQIDLFFSEYQQNYFSKRIGEIKIVEKFSPTYFFYDTG